MIYSLNQLIDWSRRTGSDRLIRQRDTLVTDGTSQVVLTTGNNITLLSVSVGGVQQIVNGVVSGDATFDITQDVNILTFDPVPDAGLQVICVYNASNYTDQDVRNYLMDAAMDLMADLGLRGWQTNFTDPTNPKVSDPQDCLWGIPVAEQMDRPLQQLIALKSAMKLRGDAANQAGDDAILIKDGDTTIDTSKTSQGSERAYKRLKDQYDETFRRVVANRASGVAIQNNWVPLPYPWSTPYMMPGDVNGPAY